MRLGLLLNNRRGHWWRQRSKSVGRAHLRQPAAENPQFAWLLRVVPAATCTVIGLTGNSVEVSGDNTRRILRIDLDAGAERPETRQFDFDSEVEAQQDRAELVVAALTTLRAHALAGWPAVPGRAALGSFED